jgi:5-methylcytosine-specific restriction endonuclease McrA
MDKKRRAILKRASGDIRRSRYTLRAIAVRDRYRCGLCHRKVNLRLAVPHPKAPTIDHIVPLAEGGDDTRANVQLAHFICNSIKGHRGGGEQLLLVG